MITTITGKNQVTLPAGIVRALGLTAGTRLDWEIGPNGALIATVRPSTFAAGSRPNGRRSPILRPGSNPIAGLISERVADEEVDSRA